MAIKRIGMYTFPKLNEPEGYMFVENDTLHKTYRTDIYSVILHNLL